MTRQSLGHDPMILQDWLEGCPQRDAAAPGGMLEAPRGSGCRRCAGVGSSSADFPLPAVCPRLLPPVFTRAISKRSLEIDFAHPVINGSPGGRRGGRAAGHPLPAPRGPVLVPILSGSPRPHPSPGGHGRAEGAAPLAPRAIRRLKSRRKEPSH